MPREERTGRKTGSPRQTPHPIARTLTVSPHDTNPALPAPCVYQPLLFRQNGRQRVRQWISSLLMALLAHPSDMFPGKGDM